MLNPDFYPTPVPVIGKMLAPYLDELDNRHILEPSAGKGDILDYIKSRRHPYRDAALYCCEADPELAATLAGKGYRVLAHDFLTFQPSHMFDLIVMNPPFSAGVDHLLHAWEILPAGDIVCLLNAETIRNAHTEKRKLLSRIIEDNGGQVEMLGPVFRGAERTTDVEVAMVRLHKEAAAGSWFAESVDRETVQTMQSETQGELAIKDDIGAMVAAYEAAKRAFASVYMARADVARYLAVVGGLKNRRDDRNDQDYLSYACSMNNPVAAYNFFVETMRRNAWDTVFARVGIQDKVTEKVRKDFERMRTENGYDFTERNVEALLDGLMLNRGQIMQDCINEAFDLMTKYHHENRIHIEGWKTNDRWMVNRKVILPYMVELDWSRGFRPRLGYSDASRTMDDIDKAMCFLAGKSFDAIRKISDAVRDSQEAESEFFRLKSHQKGTLHLTFKDKSLWERFNATACEGKNWLPDRKKAG